MLSETLFDFDDQFVQLVIIFLVLLIEIDDEHILSVPHGSIHICGCCCC